MTLNPPRRVRAVLYLIATFGLIAQQWANDKHWLDSADRTAIAGVLALVMALATANTFTPDRPRDGRGRAKPVAALLVALLIGLAGALVMLIPSPAQAYGWSGVRCDSQISDNASKVCVNVHTSPSGNGLRVDQVQVCAYKVPQLYYNGLNDTHGNTIQFWGSGGAYLGFVNLNGTGASQAGSCSLTNMNVQMGNGACYHAYGTMNMPGRTDIHWGVDGKIIGGAC